MRASLAVLFAVCACGARAAGPAETLTIACRGHELRVEIADDEPARQRGLMHRRELAPDAGMLFVWPTADIAAFWMKNTYLPLSIAFLADDGRIVNLADMEPLDEQTFHRSAEPVRFALEVNRGWFATHGVGTGDSCDLGAVER